MPEGAQYGILLDEYLSASSQTAKVLDTYEEGKSRFGTTAETPREAPTEKSDFGLLYSGSFYKKEQRGENADYAAAKAAGQPFFFLLETVPLDDGVLEKLASEKGTDKAGASAIYRQTLIDLLAAHDLYADAFFDICSYDTARAEEFELQIVKYYSFVHSPLDLSYDDSVYDECTHLFFTLCAKGEAIEAFDGFLKSDENTLVKARALPAGGRGGAVPNNDPGKEAYIPQGGALPDGYVERGYWTMERLVYTRDEYDDTF